MWSPRELSEGEKFRLLTDGAAAEIDCGMSFVMGWTRATRVAWQLRWFVAESGRGAVVATAHGYPAGNLRPQYI